MNLSSSYLYIQKKKKRFYFFKLQINADMLHMVLLRQNKFRMKISCLQQDSINIMPGGNEHYEGIEEVSFVLAIKENSKDQIMSVHYGKQYVTLNMNEEIRQHQNEIGIGMPPINYTKDVANTIGSVFHFKILMQELDYAGAKALQ